MYVWPQNLFDCTDVFVSPDCNPTLALELGAKRYNCAQNEVGSSAAAHIAAC